MILNRRRAGLSRLLDMLGTFFNPDIFTTFSKSLRSFSLSSQNLYGFQVRLSFVFHHLFDTEVVVGVRGIQIVEERVDHQPHHPLTYRRFHVHFRILRAVQLDALKDLELQLVAVQYLLVSGLFEIRALRIELERRVIEYNVPYLPETPEVQKALNDLGEASLVLPCPPVAVLDDIQQKTTHLEELPRLVEYDHPGAASVREVQVLGDIVEDLQHDALEQLFPGLYFLQFQHHEPVVPYI